MTAALMAGLLALGPGPGGAPAPADAEAGTTLIVAEVGRERLDNESPDWRSATVGIAYARGRGSLNLEWQRVERFGIDDNQWRLGGHFPLGERVAYALEFHASPDAELLPEFSSAFDLDVRLPAGFVAHAGFRRARYPEDTSSGITGGLEVYRGAWRGAVSVINARLTSGDSGTTSIAQLDRYYGDGSRIGILGAIGDEATRVAPDAVVVADVRSAALFGRHWLGRAWGVSYAWTWTELGDFYGRVGGTLGLLYRF